MGEYTIPTVYDWAGGTPAFERLTAVFYRRVLEDPLLYPIFKSMSPDHPRHVAMWLAEVFGGPKAYTDSLGGYAHMLSKHLNLGLKEEQRARWVQLLVLAADEVSLSAGPEFRSAFMSYIEWGTRIALSNSQPGAHPPLHMPVPHWDWGTAGPPSESLAIPVSTIEEEEIAALPAGDETLSFARHIKPLFRPKDRQSMIWAFDLRLYKDVVAHAHGILQRLQNGTMPCDGAWPDEQITLFQHWIAEGMQE